MDAPRTVRVRLDLRGDPNTKRRPVSCAALKSPADQPIRQIAPKPMPTSTAAPAPASAPHRKPVLPVTGCWPAAWREQPWWQSMAPAIERWKHSAIHPAVSMDLADDFGGESSILYSHQTGWVAHRLNALAALADPSPHGAALPHFIPQAQLPAGQAYEAFIRATGQVPTRDNWHDLLNGMIWMHLPRSKHQLNRIQAAEIATHGVQAKRGPVRDACTVFDENAALLFAPDALWDALQTRRWGDLFGPLRPLWAQSQLLVFGHAALEQLLAPYKSITVHVWRVPMPLEPHGDWRELDAWLAHDLQAPKLALKPFCALPILGVPGWWPANEHPSFYADPQVFRPLRTQAL